MLYIGNKKSSTSSMQYLPKLIIDHEVVPTIEIGKSFDVLVDILTTLWTNKFTCLRFSIFS